MIWNQSRESIKNYSLGNNSNWYLDHNNRIPGVTVNVSKESENDLNQFKYGNHFHHSFMILAEIGLKLVKKIQINSSKKLKFNLI